MLEKLVNGDFLASDVLQVCKDRGWSLHWTARGCYLHLEASELIEAVRGKGDSTPLEEAADAVFVLMSITQNLGISWTDVMCQVRSLTEDLKTAPHYEGEEWDTESKSGLSAYHERKRTESRSGPDLG